MKSIKSSGKKSLLMAITAILFCNVILAQRSFDPGKKEATKAFNRKMIFVIKDINSKKSKNNKNIALWELYNNTLKNAVKTYWKFNKEYEFKTVAEVNELKKTNKKDYAVLFFKDYGGEDITVSQKFQSPVSGTRYTGGLGARAVLYFSLLEDFKALNSSENEHGTTSLPMIILPHSRITEEDVYSTLLLAQGILFFQMQDLSKNELAQNKKSNLEILKNKTLLIPNDLLTSSAKPEKNYPYKSMVIPEKDIYSYFENPDSQNVILEIFPLSLYVSPHNNNNQTQSNIQTAYSTPEGENDCFFYFVFDLASGKILVNSNNLEGTYYGYSIIKGSYKFATSKSKLDAYLMEDLTK